MEQIAITQRLVEQAFPRAEARIAKRNWIPVPNPPNEVPM
jgi:hypothetical protein